MDIKLVWWIFTIEISTYNDALFLYFYFDNLKFKFAMK